MLQGMSLKGKLLFLCAILSGIMVAVGGTGYFNLAGVSKQYHHVASNNLPHVKAAGEMFRKFRQIRTDVMTLTLPGLTEAEGTASLEEIDKYIETYEQSSDEYVDAEYDPGVPFGPGEKELFDATTTEWNHFKGEVTRAVGLYKTGNPDDRKKIAQMCLVELSKSAKNYTVMMNKLIDYSDAESKKWVGTAQGAANKANWLALVIVAVGLFMAMLIGTLFAASVSKAIRKVSMELSEGAETVANAAIQISSASTELSASSTEQAAALQETVASLEQVSTMVGKNAENAKRSKEGSGSSQEAAQRGNQVVTDMIRSIQDISESNAEIMKQVEASNQEISQVVKVIAEIGDKTKVINDIVFQTKLLSFNASVEAARAGEHGKGFAVVAEEVGNLAQMSGNAAKEISQLLESSIHKVESTVTQTKSKVDVLIRTGKEKVDAGSHTAKRCGEVIEEILKNVSAVGEMVSEIATASDEQAQGVAEINKAMNQMDQVTQQNASASQEASSAAEDLTQQADALREMVRGLLATVDGGKTGSSGDLMHQKKHDKSHAQVIDIKKRKKKNSVSEQALRNVVTPGHLRKAVGAEHLPSSDDPRFEDV